MSKNDQKQTTKDEEKIKMGYWREDGQLICPHCGSFQCAGTSGGLLECCVTGKVWDHPDK